MIEKAILALALVSLPVLARPPAKGHPPQQPEVHGVPPGEHQGGNGTGDWELGIEYNRYLQEVVQVLESDPEFR